MHMEQPLSSRINNKIISGLYNWNMAGAAKTETPAIFLFTYLAVYDILEKDISSIFNVFRTAISNLTGISLVYAVIPRES